VLIRPKPGARIGEEDPVCHVKSTEELVDHDYDTHEHFKTTPGKWYAERTEHKLYSHCENKDPRIPQMDEDMPPREIPPDRRDGKGGPVWTKK
jgi:hypothetical protein